MVGLKFASRKLSFYKVPSTIVPMEHNIILNPLYKDFGKVEIIEFIDLPIDERLKTVERLKK